MKKALLFISVLVVGILITACQPETVEVTRIVTETVTETQEIEVTRVVEGEVVTETVVEEVEVTRFGMVCMTLSVLSVWLDCRRGWG